MSELEEKVFKLMVLKSKPLTFAEILKEVPVEEHVLQEVLTNLGNLVWTLGPPDATFVIPELPEQLYVIHPEFGFCHLEPYLEREFGIVKKRR